MEYLLILIATLTVVTGSQPKCMVHYYGILNTVKTDCSNQGLTRVPRDFPKNTTILDLSYNNITILYDRDFQYLTQLQKLYLNFNPIDTIQVLVFQGLKSLSILEMDGHKLNYTSQSLPENVFEPLISLTSLSYRSDVARFRRDVSLYPDRALWPLHNLTSLNIDTFPNTVFSSSVGNLTKLSHLSLGIAQYGFICGLNIYKNDTFKQFSKSPIKFLDLQGCQFEKFDLGFLQPIPNLTHFWLSGAAFIGTHNLPKLLKAFVPYRGKNMTELVMRSVRFSEEWVGMSQVVTFDILGDICLEKLDLSSNSISIVNLHSLFSRYPFPPIVKCLKQLRLNNNEITGAFYKLDIYFMAAFSKLEFLDISKQKEFFVDSNMNHLNLRTGPYPVPLPLFCPPKIQHFNYSGVGHLALEDIYLFMCDNLVSLNASYLDMHHLNISITGLENLRILDVSGNFLDDISPYLFKTFTSLTELYLRNTQLQNDFLTDYGKTFFSPLSKLETLDLSYNAFVILPCDLFEPLVSLKSLNLANNNLVILPDFTTVHSLTQVFVNHNSLLSLNETQRYLLESKQRSTQKFHISLQGNVFLCNCDNLDFILWINETGVSLDGRNYSCLDMTGTLTNTKDFYSRFKYYDRICTSSFLLSFAIGLSGIVTVSLLTMFLLVKNNMKVRIFMLRFLGRFRQPRKREEFVYDAFIIYSDSIYNWVCGDMHTELENVRKLKLNIRDFNQPYGIFEADYITESIRESWKTVFILNQDILQDDKTFFIMYSCLAAMRMTIPNKIILLRDCQAEIQANIGFFLEAIPEENIIIIDFEQDLTGVFWNRLERLICME